MHLSTYLEDLSQRKLRKYKIYIKSSVHGSSVFTVINIILYILDSVQVMSSYCDAVVIRHPDPGAVQVKYIIPTVRTLEPWTLCPFFDIFVTNICRINQLEIDFIVITWCTWVQSNLFGVFEPKKAEKIQDLYQVKCSCFECLHCKCFALQYGIFYTMWPRDWIKGPLQVLQ